MENASIVSKVLVIDDGDIDVIGRDTLAFHHEVEVALVMAEVFRALPCPPAVILVNNRKLAEGFFLGAGATDAAAA